MKLIYLAVIFLAVVLQGCDDSRLYEDNANFNNKIWIADSTATFNFDIKNAKNHYNIYLNVRNTNTYPFYNLYVKYSLEDSLGNILASELVNKNLFHEKTGEPYGSGLGDIFSHQFLVREGYKFQQAGTYQIRIQQFMRQDSLHGIVSAGIRIEGATHK